MKSLNPGAGINWLSPHAQGLTACLRAGVVLPLLRGNFSSAIPKVRSLDAQLAWSPGRTSVNGFSQSVSEGTILVRVRREGDDLANTRGLFWIYSAAASSRRVGVNLGGGSAFAYISATQVATLSLPATQAWQTIALSWSTKSGFARFALDGNVIESAHARADTGAVDTLALGQQYNGWYGLAGSLAGALIWQRALSVDALTCLTTEPEQIFVSPRRYSGSVFAGLAESAVHDLGVATAIGIAAVDVATLSQRHAVSVVNTFAAPSVQIAGAAQVHQLGVVTVSAPAVVAVGDAAEVHQLTAVSVTAASAASVPTVSQAHVLGAIDAVASAAVATAAITQTHVLGAITAAAAATITTGAISVPGGLSSSEAIAAASVATLPVQQVHQLGPVTAAATAEVVAAPVGTANALAAVDVTAATHVTVLPLTQTHRLDTAVANALATVAAQPLVQQLPPPPVLPADDFRTRSVTPVFATRSVSPRLYTVSRSPVYTTRAA